MFFIPMPVVQRREIVKDGVTYREVLPGDGGTWWEVIWPVLLTVFVGFPIALAVFAWTIFPAIFWILDHSPLGHPH